MYVMFTFAPRADGGGAFPDASPTMLEICGIAPEEVRDDASPLFRRHRAGRPGEAAPRDRAGHARSDRPGTSSSATATPRKGPIWMRARCTPLTGADGSLQWHGFINDITQRRRTSARWR